MGSSGSSDLIVDLIGIYAWIIIGLLNFYIARGIVVKQGCRRCPIEFVIVNGSFLVSNWVS